jgi:hypothetical protein
MEGDFPRRTADNCVLPNGDTVWVQTLNSFHRSEADREANFAAALDMQRFSVKGQLYGYYKQDFDSMPVETLCDFLADHSLLTGSVQMEAAKKFGIPVQPERDEKDTGNKYIEQVAAYTEAVDKALADREAYIQAARDKAYKFAQGQSRQARTKAAMDALIQSEFAAAHSKRTQFEILYRATRTTANHLEKYYASVEELMDVDDETLNVLTRKYNELDTVSAEQIPTSPDGS